MFVLHNGTNLKAKRSSGLMLTKFYENPSIDKKLLVEDRHIFHTKFWCLKINIVGVCSISEDVIASRL
jgi:hypothetical protein